MEPLEGGVGSTGCGWSGGVGEEGVEVSRSVPKVFKA